MLLSCGPAWAHGSMGDGKSLWGGASHFLTSPLSIASVVGLCAALFGVHEKLALAVAMVAGAAAGVGSAAAHYVPTFFAPAAVVVVGLCAVIGRKPSVIGALLVATIAGLAGGIAADVDAPSWPGAIGIAGAMMFPVACTLAAAHDIGSFQRLQSVLPIARRVLGSWVAAIGLLTTTLAIHLSKSH